MRFTHHGYDDHGEAKVSTLYIHKLSLTNAGVFTTAL